MRYLVRVCYEPRLDPETGAFLSIKRHTLYADGTNVIDTISAGAYRDLCERAAGDPSRDADPDHREYRHPERECPDRDPG